MSEENCCCAVTPLTEGSCPTVVQKICVHEQIGAAIYNCQLYLGIRTTFTRSPDGGTYSSAGTRTPPSNLPVPLGATGDIGVRNELVALQQSTAGPFLIYTKMSDTDYTVSYPAGGKIWLVENDLLDPFPDASMNLLLDALESAVDFNNAAARFVFYDNSGVINQAGTLAGSQIGNVHWRSICGHSHQCAAPDGSGVTSVFRSMGQNFGVIATPVVVGGATASPITMGYSTATAWGASRTLSRVTLTRNYRIRTYEVSSIGTPQCPPKNAHQCRHVCNQIDVDDFSDGLDAGGMPRVVVFDRLTLPPAVPHWYQTVTCLT